jgi:hypothetical protein
MNKPEMLKKITFLIGVFSAMMMISSCGSEFRQEDQGQFGPIDTKIIFGTERVGYRQLLDRAHRIKKQGSVRRTCEVNPGDLSGSCKDTVQYSGTDKEIISEFSWQLKFKDDFLADFSIEGSKRKETGIFSSGKSILVTAGKSDIPLTESQRVTTETRFINMPGKGRAVQEVTVYKMYGLISGYEETFWMDPAGLTGNQ